MEKQDRWWLGGTKKKKTFQQRNGMSTKSAFCAQTCSKLHPNADGSLFKATIPFRYQSTITIVGRVEYGLVAIQQAKMCACVGNQLALLL